MTMEQAPTCGAQEPTTPARSGVAHHHNHVCGRKPEHLGQHHCVVCATPYVVTAHNLTATTIPVDNHGTTPPLVLTEQASQTCQACGHTMPAAAVAPYRMDGDESDAVGYLCTDTDACMTRIVGQQADTDTRSWPQPPTNTQGGGVNPAHERADGPPPGRPFLSVVKNRGQEVFGTTNPPGIDLCGHENPSASWIRCARPDGHEDVLHTNAEADVIWGSDDPPVGSFAEHLATPLWNRCAFLLRPGVRCRHAQGHDGDHHPDEGGAHRPGPRVGDAVVCQVCQEPWPCGNGPAGFRFPTPLDVDAFHRNGWVDVDAPTPPEVFEGGADDDGKWGRTVPGGWYAVRVTHPSHEAPLVVMPRDVEFLYSPAPRWYDLGAVDETKRDRMAEAVRRAAEDGPRVPEQVTAPRWQVRPMDYPSQEDVDAFWARVREKVSGAFENIAPPNRGWSLLRMARDEVAANLGGRDTQPVEEPVDDDGRKKLTRLRAIAEDIDRVGFERRRAMANELRGLVRDLADGDRAEQVDEVSPAPPEAVVAFRTLGRVVALLDGAPTRWSGASEVRRLLDDLTERVVALASRPATPEVADLVRQARVGAELFVALYKDRGRDDLHVDGADTRWWKTAGDEVMAAYHRAQDEFGAPARPRTYPTVPDRCAFAFLGVQCDKATGHDGAHRTTHRPTAPTALVGQNGKGAAVSPGWSAVEVTLEGRTHMVPPENVRFAFHGGGRP